MTGQLFKQYFLTDGIRETPQWRESMKHAETFTKFVDAISTCFNKFSYFNNPNEAVTEKELICPMLDALGWTDYLPQQGSTRKEDIPDHLLFADAEALKRAIARGTSKDRYKDALLVQESKRFARSLDNREEGDKIQEGTPHGQILRYLSTADIVSEGNIRWGILTNGSVWRLYDQRARPRSTGFFEIDLQGFLNEDNEDGLRTFFLLFRREALVLGQGATSTFLETALAEGRRYEEKVTQDLSSVVFDRVFPKVVTALANTAGASLPEVRSAALIFLYRVLFILYAEDRGLLPVNDLRYDDYGLRKRVRDDIAQRTAQDDVFSGTAANYYNRLLELFRLIDKGDASIGLPPYNGGLFASTAAPLLENAHLSDAIIAEIIHDLSHAESGGEHRFVNYRDMSVQQLGSLYERLLEREPVRAADGSVSVRPNPYVRKDSGSFYTPQELVDLIVEQTLKPLAEERLQEFEKKAEALKSGKRPKAQRRDELAELDPAEAVLNLKVLDPAMGSGHFLVTAVDFLSDYIADLIEYVPVVPEWLDGEYVSPLVERIDAIRMDILNRADESGWVIDKAQFTDQAIIRRMVLKRCIYGVDKNPLTVELAKVSLWLHSFTVGAPLSFLDHHLRCGDSLIGLRVRDANEELYRLGTLFVSSAIQGAENAASGMQLIEEMSDTDISEVRQSIDLFSGVEKTTSLLRGFLDFTCGLRWLTSGMSKSERMKFEIPINDVLGSAPDNAYQLLSRGPGGAEEKDSPFGLLWNKAVSIARQEGFLHWQVAFPGVWKHWQEQHPQGGFDAVIGNPPWDRIKLQEVEWFATRAPNIARLTTAAQRKKAIKELREQGDLLADEFDTAKTRADELSLMIRKSGQYPLLSGGDINLYSLFVERAMNLIKPDGLVGLLTPSGIYADLTAAKFFKSVSTNGQVTGLYDFENGRVGSGLPPFFQDVHRSFKFCALTFGGEERTFTETRCGFFLGSTNTINDPDRCFPLSSEDFARVNPNTGTAPVFRSRRDADITRSIYERHPVFVDKSGNKERRVWPVRYVRMFDMTNDSHLFRTRRELEEKESAYPIGGNRFNSPRGEWAPLYEGKMVQAFDHRAASVVVNPTNLSRPAQPREATLQEHSNPSWSANPQFYVNIDGTEWPDGLEWAMAFKHVTAPTNIRTMIACLVPKAGFGNSLPIFLPVDDNNIQAFNEGSYLLTANLNAIVFDFVTRQKVQGQNLNLFVVEQLPVIASEDYDQLFGDTRARQLIRDHVLRLTYTAHDMAPFARDLGYDAPPFMWDEEERRHLRARLDALYFHLYGLTREEASYVMDTFPIVRREDEAEFGRYRTKDLILAYMNALAADDTETIVAV
ncbi:MAG: restriction endonuclease [Gammaproteobacteria bacterium]|nr:restriction endonuclease [Gammaproteobacteria bacterium]